MTTHYGHEAGKSGRNVVLFVPSLAMQAVVAGLLSPSPTPPSPDPNKSDTPRAPMSKSTSETAIEHRSCKNIPNCAKSAQTLCAKAIGTGLQCQQVISDTLEASNLRTGLLVVSVAGRDGLWDEVLCEDKLEPLWLTSG